VSVSVSAPAAPDLKEMFSLGPENPDAGFPQRLFPHTPAAFQRAWEVYYETMTRLAERLLRSFALALGLEEVRTCVCVCVCVCVCCLSMSVFLCVCVYVCVLTSSCSPLQNYFHQFVGHHASALRALNYPSLDGEVPEPGQIRASAHTDYGTLTILRADAPGLQVSKDKEDPDWFPVPFVPKVCRMRAPAPASFSSSGNRLYTIRHC